VKYLVGNPQTASGKISAHKFGSNFVGEVERQFFRQTLGVGVFLLGNQNWLNRPLK